MNDPFAYCLLLLKRRLRSRYELDQAMKRRGVEEDDRQRTLDELTDQRFVDDLRFAWAWIHTRDRLAPRGASVLRQELLQKGIAKDIILKVIAERSELAKDEEDDQPTELDLAKKLAQGKERLYSNLEPEVRKRRLMGFLQRRGFSYDVIRRILDS